MPVERLVITRYGHSTPTRHVEVLEAAHPVADAAGLSATNRIIEMARQATADDLAIALISGGASSLLASPLGGISFETRQDIIRQLLCSGAPIASVNLLTIPQRMALGRQLSRYLF